MSMSKADNLCHIIQSHRDLPEEVGRWVNDLADEHDKRADERDVAHRALERLREMSLSEQQMDIINQYFQNSPAQGRD